MALIKYEMDSLEGLSEDVKKLYIEKDGKFYLDLDETGLVKTETKDNKNMVPKSRLDQEIEKRKEAEKGLQEICDNLIEDISEDKRSIIPDLSPSKKIVWIREANKQGVFDDRKTESIDSKRPGSEKPTDFKDMNPTQIMATGYNKTK